MSPFHIVKRMIFFVLLCSVSNGFSKPPVENIAIFDKVWGFLKYHHPAVANGTINWDSVYVAHIHKIYVSKNKSQLNTTLYI